MLWTDRDFVTKQDLASLDWEINDVCEDEKVTIEGDTGVIRRGLEEAASELTRKLTIFDSYRGTAGNGVSSNHHAAVFNVGGSPTQTLKVGLDQIVVSGRSEASWTALKNWAVHQVLLRFYRVMRSRVNDDRYLAKYDSMKQLCDNSLWPTAKKLGLPVVSEPMPAPGSSLTDPMGSFSVSAVAGSGTLAKEFDVVITYIGAKYVSPTNKRNSESCPSVRVRVAVDTSKVVSVDVTGLTFPVGTRPAAIANQAGNAVGTATGWNVYVGNVDGKMYLQNATPIVPATKTYALAADPTTSGAVVDQGQNPESFLTIDEVLLRA